MLTLVWWVLSLFKVCTLTWLPVFIDAAILSVLLFAGMGDNDEEPIPKSLVLLATFGVAVFAFLKFFCCLSFSGWWVLSSAVLGIIALLFPGGFTIMNLLFKFLKLMILPTWVLIVGIVLDVIILILKIKMRNGSKKN